MAAVPVAMYHLYRFLEPLMGKWRKSAVFYVGLSSAFALLGVLFAYFVSLPGALHFLTGMNIDHIQAMLTVDSYLSFVVTYLLGAAILFQIPLLLTIINTMTPLKPGKLMKLQRFVILGAFVLAAIISPTPDVLNQTMFALPIIVMYQIGVILVWAQNRRRDRRKRLTPIQTITEVAAPPRPTQPITPLASVTVLPATPTQVIVKPLSPQRRYADIVAPQQLRVAPRTVNVAVASARPIRVPARSIDGFTTYRPPQIAGSS